MKIKKWLFFAALILTLSSSVYLFYFSKSREAFSFGGLAITASFILVVRYWLRPLLSKRWTYFNEKKSAPYIIVFMIILILCAIFLIFKLETEAEDLSIIGYFILVVGVNVEFIEIKKSKEPDDAENS